MRVKLGEHATQGTVGQIPIGNFPVIHVILPDKLHCPRQDLDVVVGRFRIHFLGLFSPPARANRLWLRR